MKLWHVRAMGMRSAMLGTASCLLMARLMIIIWGLSVVVRVRWLSREKSLKYFKDLGIGGGNSAELQQMTK
jgi:hypothetical protein